MHLETLPPDSPVRLLINDYETVWTRMRPGSGRPTHGIRIVSGKAFWSTINLGDNFTLQTAPPGVQIELLKTPQTASQTGPLEEPQHAKSL